MLISKNRLINEFIDSVSVKIKKLHLFTELADKNTIGITKWDVICLQKSIDDLIKSLWLLRLPQQIQAVLIINNKGQRLI